MKWSPDDKLLEARTAHQIFLLNPASGATVRQYDCNRSALCEFLSGDGRTAITGHADRLVRVWDASQGRLLRRLDGAYGAVQAVVLSGDGKLISAYDVLGVLSQWNVADGRLVRQSIVRPTTETDIPAPVVPGAAVPAPPVPAPAPRARPMPKVQPDSARIEPSQKLAPNGARFQIQSGAPTVFRFAAAEGDSQSDNPNARKPSEIFGGTTFEVDRNPGFERSVGFSGNGRSLVIDRTVYDLASGRRFLQPPPQKENDGFEVRAVSPDGSFAVVTKGTGWFSYEISMLNFAR